MIWEVHGRRARHIISLVEETRASNVVAVS
jgi:hypothetical protein